MHEDINVSLPPLKEGDLIGNGTYRIVSDTENAGGFGRIYRAEIVKSVAKRNTGDIVALKEFHVREFMDSSCSSLASLGCSQMTGRKYIEILLKQFQIESKLLLELSRQRDCHVPQVCQGVQNDQGRYYYVMNYIDGPTLTDVITKDGAMEEAVAINYIAQIAKVLYKSHAWDLVHNDISPNNIMLDNGVAVLVDFGNARGYANILLRDGGSEEMIQAVENIGGMISDIGIGTPCFAAPVEGFSGKPQGDIYALAATLYFLLTGSKPPMMGEQSRTHEKIMSRLAEKHVSETTTKAIRHAMTPSLKDCTQSARQFLLELPKDIVFDTLLNYNDYDYNRRR